MADLAVSEAAQERGAGRELLERVKHESGPEVGVVVLLGIAAGGRGGFCAQVRMAWARSCSVQVQGEVGWEVLKLLTAHLAVLGTALVTAWCGPVGCSGLDSACVRG